jgi:histone acetyltransferase SAS3
MFRNPGLQALTDASTAHRQCARENDALTSDEGTSDCAYSTPKPCMCLSIHVRHKQTKDGTDNGFTDAAHWRCKDCVSHGLEEESRVDEVRDRRQSSASKMARELFPATRGGIDPESHSVFNTLILDEDPLDGSRALRKRKTPMDDDDDEPRPAIRKRSKPSGEVDEDELATEDEVTVAIAGGDGTDDAASPRSRTGRPQRQLIKNRRKGMRIVSQSDDPRSLVIGIAVTAAQWDDVVKTVEKKQRRRERDRQRRARNARTRGGTVEAEEPQHFPAVQTTMYTNPFYAFPDRETDENKGKPYGGILNEAEADTAKTYPQDADRKAFAEARERAEEKWKEKMAQANGETTARTKQPGGLPSKIKCINFGGYEIDTWHAAPYPEEYSRNKHLYICEFCLKYMSSDFVAWRHKLKCSAKHPPGDEIYRDNITNPETGANTTLSFWEVDGRRNPLYCQNLCLLAKLFLGSKTLYYDVEPFLFYIMTENDEFGCHFVGYFSKEKRGPGPPPPLTLEADGEDHEEPQASGGVDQEIQAISNDPVLSSPGNNVSCILVLPVHMRRGFGRVLIEFSYLLTKQECRTGSPEKPLSDMGLVSYRSYWRTVLCRLLLRYKDQKGGSAQISIAQIARETGMTPDDIISTLESLRFLVRDPITKTYAMRLDYEYMREYVDKHDKKATIQLNQELLLWTAYVMGKPTNLFAMGEEVTINQPMQTVAPRAEAIEPPKEPEKDVQQTMIEGIAHQAKSETSQHDNVEPTTEEAVPNGSQGKEVSRTTPPDTATAENNGNITSPTRRSPRKTPNGIVPIITTSRPRSQTPEDSYGSGSQPTPADMIPPTRFEVFPPIPGAQSAAKRRPGRPTRGGSARRSHHATPNRTTPARRSSARRSTPTTATREPSGRESLRRTRSKLGTMALAADDNEVAVEDDEDDQDAERKAGGADADAVPDVEMGDADANGEEDEDEDAPGSDDDEIKYE